MKIIDKRIVNQMQEDECKQYEEETLKHLPDCTEKYETVDIELLMSQIPLRSKREETEEETQENAE
ncbi:MAG: hypothetical protein KAS98_03640 [Deltaproteobacteria bacterium]|jgi:hypothetical protein|nr:hypothetical protein [Deltaproteobacteria bacterium]MCK5421632.1 hypothetical protein [Deltaproteobacteria bacterium]MCK5513519.1 hypothetical protein [Deltaproteobacteria bacterium]